jgi:hypothetical protein
VVAELLEALATNSVAEGLIPDEVTGFSIDLILPAAL